MDITVTESEGLRLLRFGSAWCQGAMRIDAPDRLELEYALRMSAWLLFHEPATLAHKHLVTLGLGAGSLTRFAHRVLGMRTTAVEIDAAVIAVCRSHFMLPADGEGLRVLHADASDFIAQPGLAHGIDVLQVDAYDASVERPVLDTTAFYEACRASLREDGTAVVNLIGPGLELRRSVARIRAGLRPRAMWQFPPTESGNVVVLAHLGEPPSDEVLAVRAAGVARCWDLPAASWIALARRTAGDAGSGRTD